MWYWKDNYQQSNLNYIYYLCGSWSFWRCAFPVRGIIFSKAYNGLLGFVSDSSYITVAGSRWARLWNSLSFSLLGPIGIPCQDLFLGIQSPLPFPLSPNKKKFDKDSLIGSKMIFIAFSDYKIRKCHPRIFFFFLSKIQVDTYLNQQMVEGGLMSYPENFKL